MPASGRGANLVPRTPLRKPLPPNPTIPAVTPTPKVNLSSSLSSQPFKPAQQAAQKRVVQAQRALPKEPTPDIPRIASPTPSQTSAALMIAKEHQRASGKPAATYWQELRNDPRQQDYLQTVEHYAHAGAAHANELAGRIIAGGGHGPESALTPRGMAVSRGEAEQIGARAFHVVHAQASPARISRSALSDGLIVPGFVRNYLGEHIATVAPELGKVVSAVGTLAKGDIGSTGPNHSIIHNALIDLSQLPANTISSLVQTGKAGVEALAGKPSALSTIAKGLEQTVEHPLKALHERPISTALTFAGGEEAAGRAAGALARTGALGDAVRAAASTERAPLALYNDMGVKREYNPDVVRKAAQVGVDRLRASGLVPESRRQINPDQATGVRLQKAIKGGLTRPGEVDVNVAGAEQMRRQLRGEMTHAVRSARPKHGEDAVPLIVERVIRRPDTVEADLQSEAARLRTSQQGLTGAELEQNLDTLGRVEALQGDKRFLADPAPAFAAAQSYIASTKPLADALQRVGHLGPEAASRAPLFPYAIAHMGARYFSVADHQAAEVAARTAERRAVQLADSAPEGSPERDAALNEVREARATRWATSGRGRPEAIAAHEQAIDAHSAARSAVSQAQDDLRRAEGARSRLVGSQRTRRAAEGARASTRDEQDQMAALNARVRGRAEALAAARRRLGQARDVAQGSRLPQIKAGLRTGSGEFLPSRTILEHMQANGVKEPGYLSHESGLATNRGAFFKSTTRRPGAPKTRTGDSFVKGTYDRSHDALVAQASKLANDYVAHHATDARLSRFGIGRFADERAAAAEAENFSHTAEGERITNSLGPLVPTPIGRERVRATGLTHPGDIEETRDQFGITPHKDVDGDQTALAGKYTLLPQSVVDRLKEHEALLSPSAGGKLAQMITNRYRQTALFTSPRWLLGNPQEHGIRLAIAGAAPKFLGGRSGRFGGRVEGALNEIGLEHGLDAEAARLARAQLIKGTHYGAAQDAQIYRASDQFQSSPLLGPSMHGSETAQASRVGRAVLKPWHAWHEVVSRGMTNLERESRRAALGRVAIRDVQRFNGKWRNVMSMTDEQVKDYARGALKPADTAFLVKQVDEMMGAYGHLTPTVRHAVQSWSPFGLWWLTSMRYLRRLPLDHPTKTAIFAALHNAVASTEPKGVEGQTPGYLVGGIHVNLPLGLGGATLQPTYYSPAGVAIEPLRTAASLIAPLQTEVAGAGLGLNTFTGKPLSAAKSTAKENEASEGQRPEIIASKLLANLVPGVRQAEQLEEKGGTPYDTSNVVNPTVKPGTERDFAHALLKVLSPARFTYDKGAGRATSTHSPASAERAAERAASTAERAEEREERARERRERVR